MNGVTKEEVAQAKKVDLLGYLKAREPQNLKQEGQHDYRHKVYHTLVISDNGKWNWTDHDTGGTTALNYLMKVQGLDFVSAVRLVNDTSGRGVYLPRPVAKPEKEAVLHLPEPDANTYAVSRYLRNRGIHPNILYRCKQQGILYQTTHNVGGHALPNCVFIGKDKDGTPRSASLRGCQGKFRKEELGSRKCFPFFIAANCPTDTVEVYEAPIDAMSGATLRLWQHKEPWQSVHYLSLGGLNFMAMDGFLQSHPEIKQIRLCLDNDEPGRKFTERMVSKYGERYAVVDAPAPVGKDYNDCLQCQLALRQPTQNLDDILE